MLIGLGQGLVVDAMVGSVRCNIVALGGVLSAASYGVFLSAASTSVALGVVIALLATVVFTGGELVAGPVLSALSTDAAAAHLRGRYVSLYQMSWTVAMTVSPVAMTWLLDVGSAALWGALAVVARVGGVLARLLGRVMPAAAAPVAPRQPPGACVDAVDASTTIAGG